jgi:hypothetical protein
LAAGIASRPGGRVDARGHRLTVICGLQIILSICVLSRVIAALQQALWQKKTTPHLYWINQPNRIRFAISANTLPGDVRLVKRKAEPQSRTMVESRCPQDPFRDL